MHFILCKGQNLTFITKKTQTLEGISSIHSGAGGGGKYLAVFLNNKNIKIH